MGKHINDLTSKVDTAISMIVSAVQMQNTPQEKTYARLGPTKITQDKIRKTKEDLVSCKF